MGVGVAVNGIRDRCGQIFKRNSDRACAYDLFVRFSHAFAASRKFVCERSDSVQAARIHLSGFLREKKKTEAFRCLALGACSEVLAIAFIASGFTSLYIHCRSAVFSLQVFHLAGANNNKMSVPAIMTVGVVSVGTPELVEDLLDIDGISRIYFPFTCCCSKTRTLSNRSFPVCACQGGDGDGNPIFCADLSWNRSTQYRSGAILKVPSMVVYVCLAHCGLKFMQAGHGFEIGGDTQTTIPRSPRFVLRSFLLFLILLSVVSFCFHGLLPSNSWRWD